MTSPAATTWSARFGNAANAGFTGKQVTHEPSTARRYVRTGRCLPSPAITQLEASMLMNKDGWRNQKTDPPPEGVLVEVRGSSWGGEWVCMAERRDYKPGSTKAQLKRGWRWVTESGEALRKEYPEGWRNRCSWHSMR